MPDHTQRTDAELQEELVVLARRGAEDSEDWIAVQDELARRRLEDTDVIIKLESPLPLRRQVLNELAKDADLTPTEIARRLQTAPSVISRLLRTLKGAGLVTETGDPDDGRRRLYRLTEGTNVAELRAEDVPMPPKHEMMQEYLDLTFEAALRARRQQNDLDYAEDRLRRVLKAAEELPSPALALKARSELLVTLRQAGNLTTDAGHRVAEPQPAAGVAERTRLATDYDNHLRTIEAYGRNPGLTNDLVLPATGCLLYERGRSNDEQVQDRLDHLAGAALVFERYEEVSQTKYWGSRRGWALLARGELFRELTIYDQAVPFAREASECFQNYYQQYGNAEAHRLLGFCYRLLGDFTEGIAVLEKALDLAIEVDSSRCKADVLYLLGDTYRCHGEFDLALTLLGKAQELAKSLERERSLGFALSALSATQFARGDLDVAGDLSKDARPHLETSKVGLALNTRRQAVIARDRDNDDCVDLFNDATKLYEDLRSPAGQAACLVGLGKHLQRHPDRKVGVQSTTTIVKELGDICRADEALDQIRHDPWVPKLIGNWHKHFAKLQGSRHTTKELGETNDELGEIVEWIGPKSQVDGKVDEMAGEPRLLSRPPVGA